MLAVAISAFHDQQVQFGVQFHRVAQDRHVVAAQVAAEANGAQAASGIQLADNGGRPEDVAGIVAGGCHAGQHCDLFFISMALQAAQHRLRMLGQVQRFHRRLVAAAADLVYKLGVGDLNLCGVAQHERGEVLGGVRAVHFAGKSKARQSGKMCRMVGVRVRQQHGLHLLHSIRRQAVARKALRAPALKQPAVQQQLRAVHVYKVLRAGDGFGRAVKGDLQHGFTADRCWRAAPRPAARWHTPRGATAPSPPRHPGPLQQPGC